MYLHVVPKILCQYFSNFIECCLFTLSCWLNHTIPRSCKSSGHCSSHKGPVVKPVVARVQWMHPWLDQSWVAEPPTACKCIFLIRAASASQLQWSSSGRHLALASTATIFKQPAAWTSNSWAAGGSMAAADGSVAATVDWASCPAVGSADQPATPRR